MRSTLSRSECLLLAGGLAVLAVALLGPGLREPGDYHAFADQRVMAGLPYAMDVLSNIAFALAGTVGFLAWLRVRRIGRVERVMSGAFLAGLLLTAGASAWYHWQPDDARLAIDRIAMSVAFAGLLGLAVAGRVSERAGLTVGLLVLVLAPLAALQARDTGNVLSWAVLQFGGMALIICLAWVRAASTSLDVRWGLVILAYAAAKLLEAQDHAVFDWTAGWVSGHSLKHFAASLAAGPVIAALRAAANRPHNGATEQDSRLAAHSASQA